MIYVDVKGNLGNQLFQYACARKIQEVTGQDICMNTFFLSKYKPEYTFSLKDYRLCDEVCFENEKSLPFFVNTYTGIIRVLKGLFPRTFFNVLKHFGVYVWLKNEYVDLPIIPIKKNYYMVGYWQCTKFFEDLEDDLRRELTPKNDLLPENAKLYRLIQNTESVCITIRRGDYVTKYKNEFFVCDNDYFLKGVERIRAEKPNAAIFVFSDDIEWVKDNVPFTGEVYYESGNDPVWEKLRLMSACKHFVISNSSFSWWAQFLSNNKDKIVYAPSKWYPDGRKCDIYQENWRYIEV